MAEIQSGIPKRLLAFLIVKHPEAVYCGPWFKTGFFRLYNHSTGIWYGTLHEKNGADKGIVCAILYFLYDWSRFHTLHKTWPLSFRIRTFCSPKVSVYKTTLTTSYVVILHQFRFLYEFYGISKNLPINSAPWHP